MKDTQKRGGTKIFQKTEKFLAFFFKPYYQPEGTRNRGLSGRAPSNLGVQEATQQHDQKGGWLLYPCLHREQVIQLFKSMTM